MFREYVSALPVLSRRDEIGMIDLRGMNTDGAFLSKAADCLGFALPLEPRTVGQGEQVYCLWLSVDQWLVVCPLDRCEKICDSLHAALAGLHAVATDVSSARVIFRLSGAGSREVLQKGTSVDLLGSGSGFVRRALVSEVAGLVHIVSDVPDIDVYVYRSYADYIESWLNKALLGGIFKIF